MPVNGARIPPGGVRALDFTLSRLPFIPSALLPFNRFDPAPEVATGQTGTEERECMAKQGGIEMEGVVTEVLPDRNFRVLLENGHTVLAYAAGKMSKFKIRVLVGDRVTLELSPYDLSRGRITYRHKAGGPAPE